MRINGDCNCENKEMYVCEYYMRVECPETCAYARDIKGVGVGAMTFEDIKRLEGLVNE